MSFEHDPLQPLAYSIKDACRLSSLSKTKIYQLAKEGSLDLVKVNRRSMITAASLRRLLEPKS